jgi:hypothetical protein
MRHTDLHAKSRILSLRIHQQNTNKSLIAQREMLTNIPLDSTDIIVIQEPYIDRCHNTRANQYWQTIYPKNRYIDSTPKNCSLILINRRISTDSWTEITLDSSDITALQMKMLAGDFLIFNIYNNIGNTNSLKTVQNYLRE